MRYGIVSSAEIAAEPGHPLDARYWLAKRERAAALLAEIDAHGAPYTVPGWHNGERVPLDYSMALAIARSAHPSRVLANTNVYRYGKFTEAPPDGKHTGAVNVHMMGSHIATFTPSGVRLWWRGHVTVSSTEALSNLVSGGWFTTRSGEIRFRRYGVPGDQVAEEGALYPYGEVGG